MTTYETVMVVLTCLTLVVSLMMLVIKLLLIIIDKSDELVILTKIQNPRTTAYWQFLFSTTL